MAGKATTPLQNLEWEARWCKMSRVFCLVSEFQHLFFTCLFNRNTPFFKWKKSKISPTLQILPVQIHNKQQQVCSREWYEKVLIDFSDSFELKSEGQRITLAFVGLSKAVRQAGVLTCGSCHRSARPHPHRAWSCQVPKTAESTLY